MKTALTRVFMPFAFATLTGCATQQVFDHETCQTWKQSENSALSIFYARSKTEQKFSDSCHEGRVVAQVALNNRAEDGRLHPVSAYVAKEFLTRKEDDIKNGINVDYNQDVLAKFFFYSGLNKKIIDESLEPPKPKTPTTPAENHIERPTDSFCTRQGVKLVCGMK